MAVWFGADAPILETSCSGLLRLSHELRKVAALQAGDIERYVAWAWLVEIEKAPLYLNDGSRE